MYTKKSVLFSFLFITLIAVPTFYASGMEEVKTFEYSGTNYIFNKNDRRPVIREAFKTDQSLPALRLASAALCGAATVYSYWNGNHKAGHACLAGTIFSASLLPSGFLGIKTKAAKKCSNNISDALNQKIQDIEQKVPLDAFNKESIKHPGSPTIEKLEEITTQPTNYPTIDRIKETVAAEWHKPLILLPFGSKKPYIFYEDLTKEINNKIIKNKLSDIVENHKKNKQFRANLDQISFLYCMQNKQKQKFSISTPEELVSIVSDYSGYSTTINDIVIMTEMTKQELYNKIRLVNAVTAAYNRWKSTKSRWNGTKNSSSNGEDTSIFNFNNKYYSFYHLENSGYKVAFHDKENKVILTKENERDFTIKSIIEAIEKHWANK